MDVPRIVVGWLGLALLPCAVWANQPLAARVSPNGHSDSNTDRHDGDSDGQTGASSERISRCSLVNENGSFSVGPLPWEFAPTEFRSETLACPRTRRDRSFRLSRRKLEEPRRELEEMWREVTRNEWETLLAARPRTWCRRPHGWGFYRYRPRNSKCVCIQRW